MLGPILIIENEQTTEAQCSLLKKQLAGIPLFFSSVAEAQVFLRENSVAVIIVLAEELFAAQLRLTGLALPIIVYFFEGQQSGKKAQDFLDLRDNYDLVFLFSAEQLTQKINELREQEWSPYFIGTSEKINFFNRELKRTFIADQDLFIYAEPGCGKKEAAKILHRELAGDGYFRELNLLNFVGESYETHVWAALNDLYKLNSTGRLGCKTLYVKGLESKDVLFIISVLEWFCEKKRLLQEQKIIAPRVVFSFTSAALFESLTNDFKNKYLFLMIPALRERREDLPILVDHFINKFNQTYNRKIQAFSLDFMKFFLRYEWPGNIDELRYNLEPLFIIAAVDERLIDLPGLFFPRRVFAETGVVLEQK